MKDTIYYYKTISGNVHFSTGATRSADKFPEYLRMLKYAKYPLEPLFLDNEDDYRMICELFNIHGKTWREIYNEI